MDEGSQPPSVTTPATTEQRDERRNTAEAGLARGAVRAMSKSTATTAAAKFQVIGRLPAAPPTRVVLPTARVGMMPRKLPVRQVAKVSDRVSQGMDLYDLASNGASSIRDSHFAKFRSFATNLAKNTLLGMAVFQTYEVVIESMVARSPVTARHGQNPYASASVALHAVAGGLGGCMHSVAGTVWNTTLSRLATTYHGSNGTTALERLDGSRFLRQMAHHATAHAVLFASYEAIKRALLAGMAARGTASNTVDDLVSDAIAVQEPTTRIEYLGCVAVAGGLAGQAQHVVSHWTEPMVAGKWTSRPPILVRPLLVAFVPSAIAFVALEYGRRDD